MFSVNSILRISFDSSTRARSASHRTRRYFRLSRVVVPRGVFSSFSLHFSSARPGLAHRLDLAQHLALAIVDLLVGQLLVDERDELADAALVRLERVAHLA